MIVTRAAWDNDKAGNICYNGGDMGGLPRSVVSETNGKDVKC